MIAYPTAITSVPLLRIFKYESKNSQGKVLGQKRGSKSGHGIRPVKSTGPRYKIPFRLNAWTWVYLCRVLWMLGLKGQFESFTIAKKRAELAADELITLATKKDKVIVFSHGYINFYIRKSLVKKGWKLTEKSSDYWGLTKLYK